VLVLLFWYPKDFTFVCPTEIHAFQEKLGEFEKRGCKVIGASCDSAEVHFAWLTTPKANGGIEGVTFPLIADTNRQLSATLGILDGEDMVSYRATYLIDENGIVFHESVNDMPIGRNVDEYLRLLDAKIHIEKHGEVCPANWEEGKEAMNATKDGVANYLSNN
jgi:peroxiredoxin (alkyl hydroperoxide reductase subunit C)